MGMKRIKLLSLLFVAALFAQSADAALTYLPYSSYYQGRSYFNDAGIAGRVEFAVYDTWTYGNEWADATGFDVPGGDDQYIYAYQIFNDAGSAPIEFFTMWGVDNHVLSINNMGEADPQEADYIISGLDFVEPTSPGTNNSGTQAWWKFEGGTLIASGDSWFLIFSSSKDWVPGEYKMTGVNGIPPAPGSNPEPCTLALLGLGSTILFAKRKNSIKSYRVH
jgi:hypothetical protein